MAVTGDRHDSVPTESRAVRAPARLKQRCGVAPGTVVAAKMTQHVPVRGDGHDLPPAETAVVRACSRLNQQREAAACILTSKRATHHTPVRGGRYCSTAAERAVIQPCPRLGKRCGATLKGAKVYRPLSLKIRPLRGPTPPITGIHRLQQLWFFVD